MKLLSLFQFYAPKLNLKSRNYVLDFFVHLGVKEAEDVFLFSRRLHDS